MKRLLPAILIVICLASLTWVGCSSPSPYEQGLIRYNDEWITVEEYEQIKGGEQSNNISSAEFTITNFEQAYYEASGKFSDYVYIYYDIENTGPAYIRYYEAYFTAKCEDGSQYQDWTNGTYIPIGHKWSDELMIDVEGKEVKSVQIDDWELTGGTTPEVVYEITGSAESVNVTLANGTGGTEQYSFAYIPKKYAYSSFPESFLYISAQNNGEYGTVTVSIYVNGKMFKTSSSSGAYVIADASGMK